VSPSASLRLFIRVAENTTGAPRQAEVLLNGQPAVVVTQGTQPCVTGFDPPAIHTDIAGAARSATVQTSTPDCAWSQTGGFPIWVLPTTRWFGVGPATVGFGFMPNTFFPPRSTDFVFGGRVLRIEQDGATCTFATTPSEISMPANGGTGSFQVTGVGTNCAYLAEPQDARVTITSGGSGTAPATVTFTVGPYTGFGNETIAIRVANALFQIRQNYAPHRTDGTQPSFSAALGPSGLRLLTDPVDVRIVNIEQPSADYTAAADKPWAIVSPSSGVTPARLTVAIDPAQAAQLTPGVYTSFVKLTSSIAPLSTTGFIVKLQVVGANATWAPHGVFETPLANPPAGTVVSGAIPVTGWAVDTFGIRRIQIYRDAVSGEPPGLVFLGEATRVRGARPDVVLATGAPDADRAGWGYMLLTNVLPGGGNGAFTLHAFVENTEGTRVLLGSRTIAVNNAAATAPFGTIDVPAQGETVSGTIVNAGWVLTPQTKAIPADGSTIKVYIDGALWAPVSAYGLARPDVQALFAGLANSNGAGAALSIDMRLLSDGVHTIAWGVTDDAGAAVGIGSRYFTVQNGADSAIEVRDTARAAATVARLPLLKTDVWARDGVDEGGWATRIETERDGGRTLHVRRGQRLELFLDPTLRAACGSYDGHLLTGGVASDLPAGASLEPRRGIFRWQLPVETLGTFAFVFVHRGCDAVERRIPVRVVIED
jgi:hypothetical protein